MSVVLEMLRGGRKEHGVTTLADSLRGKCTQILSGENERYFTHNAGLPEVENEAAWSLYAGYRKLNPPFLIDIATSERDEGVVSVLITRGDRSGFGVRLQGDTPFVFTLGERPNLPEEDTKDGIESHADKHKVSQPTEQERRKSQLLFWNNLLSQLFPVERVQK